MRLAGVLLLWPMALYGAELIPAFPGAEGFGSTTPGGRAGKVLRVTTLDDSEPGSLRAACAATGPRVVVFEVSGLIDLKSAIKIKNPFITIAGQTAPGGGICLRGHALVVETHDVVIRYLRVRPGDTAGIEQDCISIGGSSRNVVVDHCSTSWGTDECLSPSGEISDVTVQWCMISESLDRSVHHKGAHGYGSLVRAAGGVSLHHNLWAHNHGRNPRLGDDYGKPPFPVLDVRNNVIYNLGGPSVTGDFLKVNYVGNYIKPGPSSKIGKGIMSPTETCDSRFYVEGNIVEGQPELAREPLKLFTRTENKGRKLVALAGEPFAAPEVRVLSAAETYETVLAGAGATLPERDRVDARVVSDVRKGSGAIIDSQKQVGGWPEYRTASAPRDSDSDGMPDEWETARGLNPHDASDAAGDRDHDGYTNLEEYLNSLTRP